LPLVRDDDFVDLKEVVEQAILLADFDAPGCWHRTSGSAKDQTDDRAAF
jgi:hypothetical protein